MLSISPTLSSAGQYCSGLTKLDNHKIQPPFDFIEKYNNSFFAKAYGKLTDTMTYYRLKSGNIIVDNY